MRTSRASSKVLGTGTRGIPTATSISELYNFFVIADHNGSPGLITIEQALTVFLCKSRTAAHQFYRRQTICRLRKKAILELMRIQFQHVLFASKNRKFQATQILFSGSSPLRTLAGYETFTTTRTPRP
jgi:hypothetical protein